jgi:hypothetical protein
MMFKVTVSCEDLLKGLDPMCKPELDHSTKNDPKMVGIDTDELTTSESSIKIKQPQLEKKMVS